MTQINAETKTLTFSRCSGSLSQVSSSCHLRRSKKNNNSDYKTLKKENLRAQSHFRYAKNKVRGN